MTPDNGLIPHVIGACVGVWFIIIAGNWYRHGKRKWGGRG